MLHTERITDLTPDRSLKGNVAYWMSREQRVSFNPGLLHAQNLSRQAEGDLQVVFTLADDFLGATLRHYDFMLKGLQEVSGSLAARNLGFELLVGDPINSMVNFLERTGTGTLVVDFDPLRIKQEWFKAVREKSGVKMIEVDGHNIVPARFVSQKVEFGAYTLRPKIHRNLEKFLVELPLPDLGSDPVTNEINTDQLLGSLKLDTTVGPVDWITPGEKAAKRMLREFIEERLPVYNEKRNDPSENVLSNLSPYLHFGQISAMEIAMEVLKSYPADENRGAFLEELIVRRELSDNFCFYQEGYDTTAGFHNWSRTTHELHRKDEREHLYSREEFDKGETHDPLWNAAQQEMVATGKMHGYMRMYWAKKILEWTASPEEAMEVAIWLNDRYSLDGRDPNGYTGIAWSIGGVHDRAWTERPVFGKIRYMNFNGAKRKFNVENYMQKVREL